MEVIEKIILQEVVAILMRKIKELNLFEKGFEYVEKYIERNLKEIGNLLLQELITDRTNETGFENKISTYILFLKSVPSGFN